MADLQTNTSTMMKALPTQEEMKAMIVDKSRELFLVCDKENKGFITKRDMQRLGTELPLSPDQLEAVFDSLDDDGNGFLTLEEFTDGFGGYLGLPQETVEEEQTDGLFEANQENKEYDLDEDFKRAMEMIDASDVLQSIGGEYSHELAREIWTHLKQENQPDLLNSFEDFMQKISMDVRKVQHNTDELESALKSRTLLHDEEVKKLYEEMEYQLKMEKERIASEEQDKGRRVVQDLNQQLSLKDKELHELLAQQAKLESQLEHLSLSESIMKEENQQLQKEKDVLLDQLDGTKTNLEEQKLYLKEVKNSIRRDKKERAMHTLKMTQGIHNERESLVQQLDVLRDVNKKLQDERDAFEAESKRVPSLEEELIEASHKNRPKKKMVKQGSILANYFNEKPSNARPREKKLDGTSKVYSLEGLEEENGYADKEEKENEPKIDNDSDDSIEVDEEYFIQSALLARTQQLTHPKLQNDLNDNMRTSSKDLVRNDGSTYLASSLHPMSNSQDVQSNNHMHKLLDNDPMTSDTDVDDANSSVYKQLSNRNNKMRQLPNLPISQSSAFSDPQASGIQNVERVAPVGCQAKIDMETELLEQVGIDAMVPERVFKVVFIGDSGVGKTTFLHRFTTDKFKDSFCATIGVDFRIKAVKVENKILALQLWDTAGQERFRSITKQYFRKADGVVIMYDVNSEGSFLSVRNWMNSIQDNAEEGIVKMMVGNKTDLIEDNCLKPVKESVARKLAESYSCEFMETSAKNGNNVLRAMYIIGRFLLEKEDKEIEKSVNLVEESLDRTGCCPV